MSENNTTYNKFDLIFTIGRMNPPTSGHALLLSELIRNAKINNTNKIGIVLSHTEDKKNPISCETKRRYILQMISNMDPNITADIVADVICKGDISNYGNFPITSINYLLEHNGLDQTSNILLIIGKDRAESYNWLNKIYPNLQIIALPRPPSAMSATKIRGYVSDNNKAEFDEAYQYVYDENTINQLYNDIAIGLSKYNYDESNLTQTSRKTAKRQKKGGRNKKTKTKPKSRSRSKKRFIVRRLKIR
jgi:nicotinic acid mononucleotide adenylyltransferase